MNRADVYHEALSSHRHYDSLSVATTSLLAAVIGGTPVLYNNIKELPGSWSVFALGAAIIYLTLQIYGRFDRHATVALNVAALIESGKESIDEALIFGFAYVFSNTQKFPSLDAAPGGRIYRRIKAISVFAVIIYCGIFVYFAWKELSKYVWR